MNIIPSLLVPLALAAPLLAQAQNCASPNTDGDYILGIVDGIASAMHWHSGLVWKRCAEGQVLSNGQCTATAEANTWNHWMETQRLLPRSFSGQENWGIDIGVQQNLLGSGAWRMAYKGELLGITEQCGQSPKVNRTVFPDTPTGPYWTGSPYPFGGNADKAWTSYFDVGSLSMAERSDKHLVRLLRGGQPFAAQASPAAQGAAAGVQAAFPAYTLASSTGAGTAWGGARIVGTGDPQFQVNGGAWVQEAIVQSGDSVVVRMTAPASGSNAATFTLRSGRATGNGSPIPDGSAEGIAMEQSVVAFTLSSGVAGACGSAAEASATLTPSVNLCRVGTPGTVTGDVSAWRWTCQSPDGGPAAACQAPLGYTKISQGGQALPASAALGEAQSEWGCTRDELTGRIWEVKTPHGLRGQLQKFTWFNSNPAANGGGSGVESEGNCQTVGRCDTEKYVQDVNAAGLCGATDWRMPTKAELLEILDRLQPVRAEINHDFFPNTPPASVAWSGSPYIGDPRFSHCVSFNAQGAFICHRQNAYHVRLVRAGQALAPVLSTVTLEAATTGGAAMRGISTQAGTGWWLVVPRGSPAPTPAQVRAQAGYGGVTPAAWGSSAMSAGASASFAVAGLSPGTEYDFYLTAEASGQLSAPAEKVIFVTAATLVHGACGPAAGQASITPPAQALCGAGLPGLLQSASGQYTWRCEGANGGAAAACAAPWATAGGAGVRASLDLPQPAQNNGWTLVATSVMATLPAPLPPGARSAYHPLQLRLGGGTAPQAQVIVHYSSPVPEGAVYLKYGPSPEGLNCTGAACRDDHWYALPDAEFSPDRMSVRLRLTDGGAGDGDGVLDGQIVDPGMPVLLGAPPGPDAGARAIPALTTWGVLLLSLLAVLAGGWQARMVVRGGRRRAEGH